MKIILLREIYLGMFKIQVDKMVIYILLTVFTLWLGTYVVDIFIEGDYNHERIRDWKALKPFIYFVWSFIGSEAHTI